jgi:CheY-like chemotaxis protein
VSLSGSIEDLPLLEILQVVSFCQKTGHLTVRAPEGQAAVVFRDGRVVSGYIWDLATATGPRLPEPVVRERIGTILERLVRLREGAFAFNLTGTVPTTLGGRDLSADMLVDGINTEELMLDLARKLDEDRRDCTASLEASFTAAEPAPADTTGDGASLPGEPPGAAPASEPALDGPNEDELELEELSPVPSATPEAGPPAVLLVDDEPEVCRVVGRRLADAGFDVVVAGSAAMARREMLRLSAARRRFLLVVDLGLPSESGSSFRGGLDVVRQASGLSLPPPVLLMSEAIDEKLRGRARRLGVSLLSFKPGLSKLDPLQYEADLRAFADKLGRDLLPRLEGRRAGVARPVAPPAVEGTADATALAAALAQIEAMPAPDAVAFLLLRAARATFARVVLFLVKDDRLRGLSGFGPVEGRGSLDLLARELSVPLDEPSPFRAAVATGRAWKGEIPADGPMGVLAGRIGRLRAREAAIVPLRASRQTIALVYADAPDGSALPAVEAYTSFVERAGRALEGSLAGRRTAPAPA